MLAFLACLSTGLLVNFAAPPAGQGYLTLFVMLPSLFFYKRSAGQRFLIGFGGGCAIQLMAYYWIFYTIRDFGGVEPGLSVLGTLLFCLYQGLDLGFWLLLFPLVAKYGRLNQALSAAVVWYLLQAHLFPYVFPWAYAATLTSPHWLALPAVLVRDQGLGFLLVWTQAAWVCKTESPAWKRMAPPLLLFLGLVLWVQFVLPKPAASQETWRMAVVQPNLIPLAKRDTMSSREFFEIHYQKSARFIQEKVDVILWPETAIPFALNLAPAYEDKLRDLAVETGAAVITGAIERRDKKTYNSVFLFPPDGSAPQVYRKERLVAFSEQLPWFLSWAEYFVNDIGGLDPGSENKPFNYRGKQLIPLVCYEALLSDYVSSYQGHLILNFTNDAWFGETKASSLHLQQIRMRSLELGIPMVRATNSGISCWIDAEGEIHEPTGVYEETTVLYDVPIPLNPGSGTPFSVALWTSLGILACGLFRWLQSRKTGSLASVEPST